MLQHAQELVYSLLCLMPSVYQKASLKALLGRFLSEQGHALPEHTPLKSASSLSRFLNHYQKKLLAFSMNAFSCRPTLNAFKVESGSAFRTLKTT